MTVFLYQELKSGSNGIRARPYGEKNGFNHDYGDNDNDNVSGIGKKVLLLFRAQEEDPQKRCYRFQWPSRGKRIWIKRSNHRSCVNKLK